MKRSWTLEDEAVRRCLSDHTYTTASLPSVTINNMPAMVYGTALAPGFVGLYQVAIQVPTAPASPNVLGILLPPNKLACNPARRDQTCQPQKLSVTFGVPF
jgi:hypothetical protein